MRTFKNIYKRLTVSHRSLPNRIEMLPMLVLALCQGLILACGDNGNLFSSVSGRPDEPTAGKEAAIASIVNGDWKDAETKLEALIKADPNDQQARSMLGNVMMKQAGIDSLEVSQDVTDSSDSKGTVHIPSMIKSLPEATPETIASLSKSVETFHAIPADQRTPTQTTQMAMAEFSLAMMTLKKVATNTEGTYDATKANDMKEAEATSIVGMMDTSAETVASIGGDTNTKGAGKITKTTQEIKDQEGATQADKLRAYLATESAKQKN